MKLVYANMKMLDLSGSLENCSVVESVEQIQETEDTTYILPVTESENGLPENIEIYIPFNNTRLQNGLRMYFDLECYPFYQKAKEIIEKKTAPKGVFRYRRVVGKEDYESLMISDVFVLLSLLGEPQDIQVKMTDQTRTPAHTILSVNFGGGTMAHIEFTVGTQERIELEWSATNSILEFDSDQMRSIQPGGSALSYSVDTILAAAHDVDFALINRLNQLNELLSGGGHS